MCTEKPAELQKKAEQIDTKIITQLAAQHTWNFKDGQTIEQRKLEEKNVIIQKQLEANKILQKQVNVEFAEITARKAASGMPTQTLPPAKKSWKQRQEEKKRAKKAKKHTQVADHNSYKIHSQIQQYTLARQNSFTPELQQEAEQNHIDCTALNAFISGYYKNKNGEPLNKEEAAKKEKDEALIRDYISGDVEKRAPHLKMMKNIMLNFEIEDYMLTDEYISTYGVYLFRMHEQMELFKNIWTDPINAPYFESLPELERDLLQAKYGGETNILSDFLKNRFALKGISLVDGQYYEDKDAASAAILQEAQRNKDHVAEQLNERKQALNNRIDGIYEHHLEVLAEEPLKEELERVEKRKPDWEKMSDMSGLNLTGYYTSYTLEDISFMRHRILDAPKQYEKHKETLHMLYQQFYRLIDTLGDLTKKLPAYQVIMYTHRYTPGALGMVAQIASQKQREIGEEEIQLRLHAGALIDLMNYYLKEDESLPQSTRVTAEQYGLLGDVLRIQQERKQQKARHAAVIDLEEADQIEAFDEIEEIDDSEEIEEIDDSEEIEEIDASEEVDAFDDARMFDDSDVFAEFDASEEVNAFEEVEEMETRTAAPHELARRTREEATNTYSDQREAASREALDALRKKLPKDAVPDLEKALEDYCQGTRYTVGYTEERRRLKVVLKELNRYRELCGPNHAASYGLFAIKQHLDAMTNGTLIPPDPEDILDYSKMRPEEKGATFSVATRNAFIRKLSYWSDQRDTPLFSHEPTVNDLKQRLVSNCYMVASTAGLVNLDPELLKECIRDNMDGTVTVRLFKTQKVETAAAEAPVEEVKKEEEMNDDDDDFVVIDDVKSKAEETEVQTELVPIYVKVSKEIPRIAGADALSAGALWMQMIEKACAFVGKNEKNTGYRSLWYGEGGDFLQRLIGVPPTNLRGVKEDELFERICNSAQDKVVFNAGTYDDAGDGMNDGHAYTVMGGKVEEGQRYVLLRNPYSTMSLQYDEKGSKSKVGHMFASHSDETYGQFYMRYEDFIKSFDRITSTDLKLAPRNSEQNN